MSAQPAGIDEAEPRCWCCGRLFSEADLVHLGSHPEVTVCFGCAAFLHRRARASRDAHQPSMAGRGRAVLYQGREFVVQRGWHTHPIAGPPLRWLGNHLP